MDLAQPGVGVSGAREPCPMLGQSGHGNVVPNHWPIEADNFATQSDDPETEVRVLAREKISTVTPDRLNVLALDEQATGCGSRGASRATSPVQVHDVVQQITVRKLLVDATENGCHLAARQYRLGCSEEAGIEAAVPIQKQDC